MRALATGNQGEETKPEKVRMNPQKLNRKATLKQGRITS